MTTNTIIGYYTYNETTGELGAYYHLIEGPSSSWVLENPGPNQQLIPTPRIAVTEEQAVAIQVRGEHWRVDVDADPPVLEQYVPAAVSLATAKENAKRDFTHWSNYIAGEYKHSENPLRPAIEYDTYESKGREAEEWLEDTTQTAPDFVALEAAETGETEQVVATRIQTNWRTYRTLSAKLTGKRRKFENQVDALAADATAQSLDDILHTAKTEMQTVASEAGVSVTLT